MKILKIELQNINSLKSETPIVIDFEMDQFKDVGLYAITGSTGAGKSTILDAITIALYHQVPRFNQSNIKAGLKDVVSYGASEAFSRVVFENKGERFEAYWSMRLTSKTGKELSNPQEEVRLKNMTSNKILAEKKREVQVEIERVTQLDYNQFLRSMMLAQGEFASFLSANAQDKGTLLEQITGEEIYKKIGDVITQRLADERKKLDAIKAKINSEDLLTSEQRIELQNEQEGINVRIEQLEKELSEVEKITIWYKNKNLLLNEEEENKLNLDDLELKKKESQPFLERLQLNEKAEFFKELLQSIDRIEKEIEIKKVAFKSLNDDIELLIPKIESSQKQKEESIKLLNQKEESFKSWLPKLERVSNLDTTIESENNQKAKIIQLLTKTDQLITSYGKNTTDLSNEGDQLKEDLKKIEVFVNENHKIPEIEKLFSDWSADLIRLKGNKENMNKDIRFCQEKENDLSDTAKKIEEKNIIVLNEKKHLDAIKAGLSEITQELSAKNLEQLLVLKSKGDKEKENWKSLRDFSEFYNKNTETKSALVKRKKLFDQDKSDYETLQKELKRDLEKVQIALNDAEKIVNLERSIKDFEEERKNLVEGKPCIVCGATHHPYVEKYKDLEVSKSQEELEKRKIELDQVVKKSNKLDIDISKITTSIEHDSARINEIDIELKLTTEKAVQLNLDCELKDIDSINLKIKSIENEIGSISENISTAQLLQKQKDEKEKVYTAKYEEVRLLDTEISTLNEKIKHVRLELSIKQEDLKINEKETAVLENSLNRSLSEYNFQLPTIEGTIGFIRDLEKRIFDYNSKSKELLRVKNEISEIEIKLANIKDQVSEKKKEKETQQVDYKEIEDSLSKLLEERIAILPIEISTEQQRLMLQKTWDEAKINTDLSLKNLQDLMDQKSNKDTQKDLTKKSQTEFEKVLESNLFTLDKQITESVFLTQDEIKKALLSAEDKIRFTGIKKELDTKTVQLHTLISKLEREITQHEKQKNFETSEEDAHINLTSIKSDKEVLLKRSGEINKSFDLDNQIIERNKGVFEEIKKQELVLKKWMDLLKLLGGSKHAFNTYVQRLTLQNLIVFANIHLFKLNKRYSLKMNETYKPGEELNFKLTDHYQTDQTRYVDTSSGGEKFLISLALALGLSDLASNNVNIDSLFIDEGFGSLDNNTLETVISTLETLQAQGKTIGIISHVENLKERIPIQIQVIKKSNGVSVVEIV